MGAEGRGSIEVYWSHACRNEDLIGEHEVSRRLAGNREALFGEISIHLPRTGVIFRGTLIFRRSRRPVKLPSAIPLLFFALLPRKPPRTNDKTIAERSQINDLVLSTFSRLQEVNQICESFFETCWKVLN